MMSAFGSRRQMRRRDWQSLSILRHCASNARLRAHSVAARGSLRGNFTAGVKITRKIKYFPEAHRVVLELEKQLADRLRIVLKEKYDLEIGSIPLETPPELRLGEIATPIAFELARKLRKAPKIIAQEIVTALGAVDGFAKFEVAGAGYINAYLDRGAAVRMTADLPSHLSDGNKSVAKVGHPGHALVEHTSINPNKAAHIGHLRNAILGDTFVRLLRAAGYKVDVQNYIDNTGVQVADVVVGFLHLEKQIGRRSSCTARRACTKTASASTTTAGISTRARRSGTAKGPTKKKPRANNCVSTRCTSSSRAATTTAEIADLISTAVLRRHLETMLRLGIEYDFLPRESEILHLEILGSRFRKAQADRRALLRKRRQE